MKILSLALACTGLLAFTVACADGSNITDCTVDADCAALVDTPVCIDAICQADTSECAADVDCQIAFNDGDDASPACSTDAECDTAAAEICASGFSDVGFCVASDDGTSACTDAGGVVESVSKVEGGSADACLDPAGDRSCGEDGTCTVL